MASLPQELAFFAGADEATRKVIRQHMKRRYRRKRERFWLNMFGLLAGFVIAVLFVLVAAWLIDRHHAVGGTILGSFDLVALVAVFVYAHAKTRPPSPAA